LRRIRACKQGADPLRGTSFFRNGETASANAMSSNMQMSLEGFEMWQYKTRPSLRGGYLEQWGVRYGLRTAFVVAALLGALMPGSGNADNYVLDIAPYRETGTIFSREPYTKPSDPGVCSIYLKNLNYFAHRNVPMSCERSIAPSLEKLIQRPEWQDLDPHEYPELLRDVVAKADFWTDAPPDQTLDSVGQQIKRKVIVFRRLRWQLKGVLPGQANQQDIVSSPDQIFHIVQYGFNVVDTTNHDPTYRCAPHRGGPLIDAQTYLKLFIVDESLQRVINRLYEPLNGDSGSHVVAIRGRLYVEGINSLGNIDLKQLQLYPAVALDSVCFYHFVDSSHPRR
jgi:hypothetical protein